MKGGAGLDLKMKFLICVMGLLLVGGCTSSGVKNFHSKSEIPAESFLVTSNLNFIKSNNKEDRLDGLGVFSGTDNDSINYVMFAPCLTNGKCIEDKPFQRYDIARGSFVNSDEVENLIEAFRETINNWSESYTDEKAKFIEFEIVSKNYIQHSSEVIPIYESQIRYIFQKTKNGPMAQMWYGELPNRGIIVFKSLEQVMFLLEKVERAKRMWPVKTG